MGARLDTGVVDEDVDRTLPRLDLRNQAPEALRVAEVGGEGRAPGRVGQGPERVGRARHEADPGPTVGQVPGEGSTDRAGGSCEEHVCARRPHPHSLTHDVGRDARGAGPDGIPDREVPDRGQIEVSSPRWASSRFPSRERAARAMRKSAVPTMT